MLVYAPGSLMIDTFRRMGYTSDTNIAVVYLLREMAGKKKTDFFKISV